jgi:hypothetical protein
MDDYQELLIREEARFVLWALRCAAAAEAGDDDARAELERGFELVDVAETNDAFAAFALALCRGGTGRIEWHEPACACVSAPEMAVLHQLATIAARLHAAEADADRGWEALVPAVLAPRVDRLARGWLLSLREAGICFPEPSQMIASLSALQNFIEPPPSARLQ